MNTKIRLFFLVIMALLVSGLDAQNVRDGRSARALFGAPRATFTVNFFADDAASVDLNPGDGVCVDALGFCGLRAAIMEANALPGFDAIVIPNGVVSIYSVGSDEDAAVTGDLDITDPLEIQGNGGSTTVINALNLNDRAFHIFDGAVVDFYNFAIINGDASANSGPKVGGAIFIHCGGDLLIDRLSIGFNTAVSGGGIALGGCPEEPSYLHAYNSAIYNNVGMNSGGGIQSAAPSEVTLVNVSVSLNLSLNAAAGIVIGTGSTSLNMDHSTVAENDVNVISSEGAGVRIAAGSTGENVIANSIIAHNTLDNGAILSDCNGAFISGGDNIYTSTGCTVTADDIVNASEVLGPLQVNEPGEVPTHLITTDSSAFDKDDDLEDCWGTTDARGVVRPEEYYCDSGAYELITDHDFPGIFYLLTPDDGIIVSDYSELTEFTWEEASDAVQYQFDIYSVVGSTQTLVYQVILTPEADSDPLTCSAGLCTLTVNAAIQAAIITNSDYLWFVNAISAGGWYRNGLNSPRGFTMNLPATPTVTNTPEITLTPTPTETLSVTETPTATATGIAGTELIQNGSFENLDGDGKPDITPWIVKNESGDKAKCNKDKDGDGIPDKIFANTGNCAFRFKNVEGEAGKLEQTIDLSSVIPAVGDNLNLSVAGQTKGGATAKVKVIFKYGDDTKTKITVELTNPDIYAVVTASDSLTSTAIVKSKISIKSAQTSGKVYVDDVSLIHEPASGVIRLPGASLRNP